MYIGDTMTPWMTPRRAAAAAAALAVLVHLGALANGFAYDDNILILGDEGLRSFSGLFDRLLQPSWPAAFAEEIGAWRPVTTGTWALTWIASDGSPVAFHALGIGLHALATALGVLLLAHIVPLPAAAAAGLLFAVHPVHVEAVANVAGTAEPLSAVLALAALLVHVRGGRTYGWPRVLVVTALYTLALLAKEGAVIVPILIVLLDGVRWDVSVRAWQTWVRERWVLFASMTAALAAVLAARHAVIGAIAAASYPAGAEVLRTAPRSWTVFSTWPEVVRLMVFPLDLVADYGSSVIPIAYGWTPSAILGAVLGLGAFCAALALWRRGEPATGEALSDRMPALAVLWVAAALLPVANVLYLSPVLIAERTMYLASWGAALLGGWLVASLVERSDRRAWAIVGLLVMAGGTRTVTRVPDWKTTETIMQSMVDQHPESGVGWMYLGRRLAAQGQPEQALTAFSYGVGLLNSEYRPSTELAAHLVSMGRPAAAAFFLRRAWAEHPEWPTAPGLLAAAELGLGRPDQAIPPARAAVLLDPENGSLHHLLAQSLAGAGDWQGAVTARRASIARGFGDRASSWLRLAQEELNLGDSTDAIAAIDSAAARDLGPSEREVLDGLRRALGMVAPGAPNEGPPSG